MSNINDGIFIITTNVDDNLYTIHCPKLKDLLDDWNGDCNMVPANDAVVFFAAVDGVPVNPYLYTDFENLIQLLAERELKKQCAESDTVWDLFHAKWGENIDRESFAPDQEKEFILDCYKAYETCGFVPFFQSSESDMPHNGERYNVIEPVSPDDCEWDLESLPAWRVRFENGDEYYALPEEICFCEIFPFTSTDVLPVLDMKLEDDETPTGGISYIGETVMNFLLEVQDCGVSDLHALNKALKECGIKPVVPCDQNISSVVEENE